MKGAALPLVAAAATPARARIAVTVGVTLVALALLGDLGARLGGAPRRRATVRVLAWGVVAMGITAGIGALVGTVTRRGSVTPYAHPCDFRSPPAHDLDCP